MTEVIDWDALAARVLANFTATGQWYLDDAPPSPTPEVDWNALAAQVLATFQATGQWYVTPPVSLPPALPDFVFAANDLTHGTEPWVSDGTEGGTRLLVDLNPGGEGSGFYFSANSLRYGVPAFVPTASGALLFAANDGTHGSEPWVTDGSAEGTRLLADLVPGAASSFPGLFVPLGTGTVLFQTNDASIGQRFWLTDGTAAGTREAPQFETGNAAIGAGDFTDLGGGAVLFITVADLRLARLDSPGSDLVHRFSDSPFNASLGFLASLGDGRALFRADDGVHGIEPWITDGTAAGTHLLGDLAPGSDGSFAAGFVALGDGRAFFSAFDAAHGRELWITDGTEAGTRLLDDIHPGQPGNSFPALVPIGGGRVVFSADDGVHGEEPWVTDGSVAGTMLLRDIAEGPVQAGGPGVPSLGNSFPGGFTPLGEGRALFSAFEPTHGQELWVTDGTPGGTSLVLDLLPGTGSGSPRDLSAVGNGWVAFTANDGVAGAEPWISDGSASGTFRLADIIPGAVGSDALGFAPLPTVAHLLIG